MARQLLKKEFYLQRSSLFFACAVVLVWGVLMAMAPQATRVLIPKQLTMGQLLSLMQAFFVSPCLMGIIPLFVGAAMVAEERRLEVWDWHLSLPASRRRQWALKLAVGTLITLALALMVQPALDGLMTRALAGRGDPFPLRLAYLRGNTGYLFMPLLLMAAGAFVSSLTADPYKAFFGGLGLFIAVLACARLIDPAGMMLSSWQAIAPEGGRHSIVTDFSPLWVLMMSAILGWLAWFNFRYEGLRWRRLILEIFAMIVLISAATDGALRFEFSPMGLLGRKAADVEPMIASGLRQAGYDPPAVHWTGIEPLLVKRQGLFPNRRRTEFWSSEPLGHLYRLPGTSRILAEVNSFSTHFPWHQIVEIDLTTRQMKPVYQLLGSISQVFPKYSAFTIRSSLNGAYLISQWPVPIEVGGFLWSVWAAKKSLSMPGSPFPTFIQDKEAVIDGRKVKYESNSIYPVNANQGYFQLYMKQAPVYETWLIRRKSDGNGSMVDKQQGYMRYTVSSDGKWFARGMRTDMGYPSKAIAIHATDGPTSWTLSSPLGNLILCDNGSEYDYFIGPGENRLGATHCSIMPVSSSGRFLPFMRNRTIKLDESKGKLFDTGYPDLVEIGVLDLQNGKESVLLKGKPERTVQDKFKNQMQDWLWSKWKFEFDRTQAEGVPPRIGHRPMRAHERELYWHSYYSALPPMVWAPGRDTLAILYDGEICLFDYLPEVAADRTVGRKAGKTFESMGGFVPTGRVSLIGFQVSDLDFWDAADQRSDTMLAWGNLGLFKIDLAEATRSRPSASGSR